MKGIKPHIFILLFFLSISILAVGQEKLISVQSKGKKLGQVLENLAAVYQLQFAFDADYFAEIEPELNYEGIPVSRFLDELCKKHHLLYEKIENTWVIYKNPTPVAEKIPEFIRMEGLVIDKHTGEPLLFCNIGFGASKGTITNELGIFGEKIEKTDQLAVEIGHLGYQRLDTMLRLVPGKFHRIALTPFAFHIEAINVYQQEKDVLEMRDHSEKIAFNPKQAANMPRLDDGDLVTALSLIPGVNFLGGQTQGISIRGGSPSENLILLDGIPVLETSHLFGSMSVLNAKYISQAFVSRGAFDATLGERTSGIIELSGKNSYYKPAFDLSANLLNVNATANIPVGKTVSLSGAFRKSYIDVWENYLYKQILEQEITTDEESTMKPVVYFDDLNLKISLKPTEKQEISFNVLTSNDQQTQDYLFNEGSRFYRNQEMDSKNRGFSGNWRYQAGSHWQHHLNFGYNELDRSSLRNAGMLPNSQGHGGKTELDQDDNQLEELMASLSSEFKTGRFTHQLGFGARTNQVSYLYRAERSVGNIPVDSINYDSKATILHAYFQESIQPAEKVQLRAGLRVNKADITDKLYLQPRYGISYKPTDDLNLFYSGGTYNQFLSQIRKIDSQGTSELVWFLPDTTGNGIMKARQHVIGAGYEKNGLSLNVESYYKKTSGKINLYAEVSGGKEKFIEYVTHPGQTESYGLDALIHYQKGNFTHMLSASLSKSTEQFEVFNNGESYPPFDDQRLKLRWTEMAKYKSWVFSASLNYHSGSPYLITETDSQSFGRLPYFAQTDLSVIKRFSLKYFSLSSGFSILNLFNRENVLMVDYFKISDSTGSYSIRTDITSVKFTPVFFINIRSL
ncbi:TonB-dependent receptor plug domain-containing protein [Gaoshiqia sp. Z1-71]|uniref:TonB-dependent receptor plug domain-containing protein n=1 Tax=Gaoshiqia hydrogeniformans TaxID=3290090 RepID=UPI003BF83BE1